jgi:signal transduction histidine kinase
MLLIIGVMNETGSLYILLALNFVSILFIILFLFFSERIRKLYLSKQKYRSVLIDLINQLIKIRDDEELINHVVKSLSNNSEFDKACIYLYNHKYNSILYSACQGMSSVNETPLDLMLQKSFIDRLKKSTYLHESDRQLMMALQANIIFPIIHDKTLHGVLILATSKHDYKLITEDIELFRSLTNQIAFTLENNAYIRKSNEVVKNLTESNVREEYLKRLEASNATLDTKNKQLQDLYDELKNTQSQLIQSEKMSSLGQLVAGISHELNNPIGFIYSNSNQLQKYIKRVEQVLQDSKNNNQEFIENVKDVLPDVKGLIEDTISGSKIVKELVDNLRRFSHLDQAKRQNVDIHEGIESSLKILHSQIKNKIKVHKNFRTDLKVECNPGQINQVLLNILSNATQAIKNSGNIWIDTGIENDYLFIKIKDDGQGIEKDNLEKIFDPFFTTKPIGEGTGLGLSISYSIIKNHSGTIMVDSEVNKGSTFSIKLPFK